MYEIIGQDKNGIYLIQKDESSQTGFIIQRYDNEMNLQLSKDLLFKDYFEGLIQLGNEIYLFSSSEDYEQKKNLLFCQKINKTTLEPETEKSTINEIDFQGIRKNYVGSFSFRISDDKSKILVFSRFPYEKGGNEKFQIQTFDSNMHKLWSKKYELPYRNDQLKIETRKARLLQKVDRYKIDNHGNVYLLAAIYQKKIKPDRSGAPNDRLALLCFRKDKEFKEIPINLDVNDTNIEENITKFISDIDIKISESGDISCLGLYSSERKFRRFYNPSGVFLLKFDGETFQSKVKKTTPIPLDRYLHLKQTSVRKDGSILMSMESILSTTIPGDSRGYSHDFFDITILSLDSIGQFLWYSKIPKKQHHHTSNSIILSSKPTKTEMTTIGSYTLLEKDDALLFIFNDVLENLSNKNPSKVKECWEISKNPIIALVKINTKDGSQTKTSIVSGKEKVMIDPRICKQISRNEIILIGEKDNHYHLAKLKVN